MSFFELDRYAGVEAEINIEIPEKSKDLVLEKMLSLYELSRNRFEEVYYFDSLSDDLAKSDEYLKATFINHDQSFGRLGIKKHLYTDTDTNIRYSLELARNFEGDTLKDKFNDLIEDPIFLSENTLVLIDEFKLSGKLSQKRFNFKIKGFNGSISLDFLPDQHQYFLEIESSILSTESLDKLSSLKDELVETLGLTDTGKEIRKYYSLTGTANG